MMPFSVLRMWTLGLLGWAVLGVGIYLLYEWADGVSAPVAVRQSELDADPAEPDVADEATPGNGATARAGREERTVIGQADSQGGTPYLLGGLALVLLSTVGALPVLPFLAKPPFGEPHEIQSRRDQRISRPDGSTLYVEHYGPETGPTLVFTHGWSLDRTVWYYAVKHLGERYHLVLWDLAGLGNSTRPENGDHSIEKMAGDLEAVVREATDGPVILVGHSIGGMVQQTFCRLFPQHLNTRVRGIVFAHTTYTNPVKTVVFSPLMSAIQKPILEPLNYLTIALSPLVWLSNWQSYCNGSLHLTTRWSSFAGTQSWGQIDRASRLCAKASPAVVARGNFGMVRFDELRTLPQVYVPALVVTSANDRMTKPVATQTIAQQLPDAKEVILSPAGHLGHWERHPEFYDALTAFVDSRELTSTASDAMSSTGAKGVPTV